MTRSVFHGFAALACIVCFGFSAVFAQAPASSSDRPSLTTASVAGYASSPNRQRVVLDGGKLSILPIAKASDVLKDGKNASAIVITCDEVTAEINGASMSLMCRGRVALEGDHVQCRCGLLKLHDGRMQLDADGEEHVSLVRLRPGTNEPEIAIIASRIDFDQKSGSLAANNNVRVEGILEKK
jgi:hypothetical protein